jgi:hypothetical protein
MVEGGSGMSVKRRRQANFMKPAIVEWEDAAAYQEDTHVDKLLDEDAPVIRKTVGWFIGRFRGRLYLCTDNDGAEEGDHAIGTPIKIPVGMVRKITFLKEAEARKIR